MSLLGPLFFALTSAVTPIVTAKPSPKPTILVEEYVPAREPRRANYARAVIEELIFLGPFGLTLYWTNQDFNQRDWELKWDWESWKQKIITFDAVRFDSNDYWTNAATHAASGVIYYWIPRSNGLSIAESFGVATLSSAAWEYLVEFKERPSLNDIIYTPFAGMPVGESLMQLGELFDRGSDGIGVRILAELFGAPRKLHDRLDGACATRATEFDALGLPADVHHAFLLHGGYEARWVPGGADPLEGRALVGFSSEVVDLPHYGAIGHAAGFVTDRGFTRLAVEAALGDRRLERLVLDARASLFGWYHHEVTRDARGDLAGSTVFVGAASELEYTQRWIGTFEDRLTTARMFGPAVDVMLHAGGLTVHASLDVSLDFGMVTSLATATWLRDVKVRTKAVVQDAGYYYAFGVTADPELTLAYGALDAGFSARFDAFSSIDGRDRVQDVIVDDAHLTDRRLEWTVSAGLTPIAPLRFSASFTQRYRESHVAAVSASHLERTAVVGASLLF